MLILGICLIINYSKIINHLIIWRWMRKLSLKKHQIIFNRLYQNINGFKLSKNARIKNDAPEYTYGEINFLPFIALLSQVQIDENTIFYDLGSGTGKAVLACSMTFNIKSCIGVELFPNLHECALNQKTALTQIPNYTNQAKKINLINDNFLNIDLDDATLIFINATAFIGDTWEKLNDKFTKLQNDVTIITISKKINAINFKLQKTTYIEMSWGVALAYIYCSQKKLN